MANIKQTVKLGVFTLAIMNVTAVVSLRGLPAEAVYGMSSAFYYLFAAIVFLIPTSLVAAELAAMFQDKQGGVNLSFIFYKKQVPFSVHHRKTAPAFIIYFSIFTI